MIILLDDPVDTNLLVQTRLVGPTPSEGRVEVLYEDQWGTICYDGWGYNDAFVICRQAGNYNWFIKIINVLFFIINRVFLSTFNQCVL